MHGMIPATERRLALVWLALSAITILSWWLGSKHGPDIFAVNVPVTVSVILIALVKVRFIMMEFMEARLASAVVRRMCDVWLIAMCIGLFAAYLLPQLSGHPV
jgi:apolipoprotein N-acyltransferase